jgi:dihydrodipicolinate synthase/N-acetylneuraminate lyase
MLMDGLHVTVMSPFYRDGQSYLRKLEHNVARYSLTPVAGLVALTGEPGALSDAERREVLAAIGQTAAPEKVLIAGIAQDSVRGALAVTEEAERARFDAVLLGTPSSWASLQPAERMVWFRAIADASPLPVMLFSDAGRGVLEIEMLAELAAHPKILGLYDAGLTLDRLAAIHATVHAAIQAAPSGLAQHEVTVTTVFAPVTRRMLEPEPAPAGSATFVTAASLAGGAALAVAPPKPAIKTRTKTVGFQIMAAGRIAGLVDLLEAGAAGAMPALSACAPQACYEVYAAFKDGDPALAREKEHRLLAADALLAELGVAAIKYGCDLNGYYGGAPRLPRLPLTAAARAQVESVLAGLKN